MAAVTRQPFAPLDGARLQNLTSARNKQASIGLSSPGKRKAADFLNVNNFENVDPALLFSKRSKAASSNSSSKGFLKPTSLVITKSSSTPTLPSSKDDISASVSSSPLKDASPRPRSILKPKSPAKKLSTLSRGSSTPMSAPAGRSPTRGTKRIGILNTRRTGAFTRIDPPTFSLSSTPFSLEAAIKGTVPSYAARTPSTRGSSASSSLSLSNLEDFYGSTSKSSWEFDIHEDTPEQEITNLLQHSTCRLDISSDEECERKLGREKAEDRGKENVPPADDVSQTSARRTTTTSEGGMEYEKPRTALGDLNVEDFYAQGCDLTSVFIVPEDDDDGTVVEGEQPENPQDEARAATSKVSLEINAAEDMPQPEESEAHVKLVTLQPVEGTGEIFDLWESSSAKEEGDGAPSPMPASPCSEPGEDFGDEG